MTEYKIETGIPVPKRKHSGGRPARYPLASMDIGQSIRVPGDEYLRVIKAASVYGKRVGKRFQARRQEDGSVRCWRVE